MRNKYSEAYKTSVVKMVLVEGKSSTEVAHNLGLGDGRSDENVAGERCDTNGDLAAKTT